jgi:hypothetical protein
MDGTTPAGEVAALVREGWRRLQLQQPIAAWAAWRRALGLESENRAARDALDRLSATPELPAAAKAVYHFRPPRDAGRRERWDDALSGRAPGLDDLDAVVRAFQAIAGDEPADADAAYNAALGRAWLGQNPEAIGWLDRSLRADATDRFDAAAEAWTLAEVLRQGSGAEEIADDLSYTLAIAWPEPLGDPLAWLESLGSFRRLPTPSDPTTGEPPAGVHVGEWLDRPLPAPDDDLTLEHVPRVRASVIARPGSIQFASPRLEALRQVESEVAHRLGRHFQAIDRHTSPLPIHLMDLAVWQFRLPDGLDDAARRRLTRDAIEHYYEHEWIHVPRHGLAQTAEPGGTTVPVTPAGAAVRGERAGDAAIRARLAGVVRMREQLAERPHVRALYEGYPFDRLRRRLGLEPDDPSAIEPDDLTYAGPGELARLDPVTLEEDRLVDAFRGALDDDLRGRLALALARRDPSAALRRVFPDMAVAAASAALEDEGPESALALIDGWIERSRDERAAHRVGPLEQMLGRFRLHLGDDEAAAAAFREAGRAVGDDPAGLVEAAEGLIEAGAADETGPLLDRAEALAEQRGDWGLAARAASMRSEVP